jgi:hypothetical protein
VAAALQRLPPGDYEVRAWDADERTTRAPVRIAGQAEERVVLVLDGR